MCQSNVDPGLKEKPRWMNPLPQGFHCNWLEDITVGDSAVFGFLPWSGQCSSTSGFTRWGTQMSRPARWRQLRSTSVVLLPAKESSSPLWITGRTSSLHYSGFTGCLRRHEFSSKSLPWSARHSSSTRTGISQQHRQIPHQRESGRRHLRSSTTNAAVVMSTLT